MQIKKFTAPTLKEASKLMKEELGEDAIIIGTKVIDSNGTAGGRRLFELTAGLDGGLVLQEEVLGSNLTSVEKNDFTSELKKLSDKIYITPLKPKNVSSEASDNKVENGTQVQAESIEAELKEIVDTLLAKEVQKPLLTSILDQLKKYKNFLHSSNIDSYVVSSLASMIPTTNFELKKNGKPKVVALVGPTGVGKTTCIAKLAIISKILHNLDVGLISIDTYRLGAIDQLRIFSEISTIDMLVAYEKSELPALIDKFKKKDIIFIDTAGRSQKNADYLKETKGFLDAAKVDETYLVLSSTSATKTLFDVAERFKIFDYNAFVYTKIDEAVTFGNILNVSANFNTPVVFLTNGQVIPDDIVSADSEHIANLIYTGKTGK